MTDRVTLRALADAWALRRVPSSWTFGSQIVEALLSDEEAAHAVYPAFRCRDFFGSPIGPAGLLNRLEASTYIESRIDIPSPGVNLLRVRRTGTGSQLLDTVRAQPELLALLESLPLSAHLLLETMALEVGPSQPHLASSGHIV